MKIVKVKWVDSSAPKDGGWYKRQEMNMDIIVVNSAGYLVEENKKQIIIASSVMENGLLHGLITIPQRAILKKKVIG